MFVCFLLLNTGFNVVFNSVMIQFTYFVNGIVKWAGYYLYLALRRIKPWLRIWTVFPVPAMTMLMMRRYRILNLQ